MDNLLFVMVLACLVTFISGQDADEYLDDEKKLYRDLLAKTNSPDLRPVNSSRQVLKIKYGLSLLDIIDVNEKSGILTLQIREIQLWQNFDLKWDPGLHGGVTTLQMPRDKIWTPDISLYNAAQEGTTRFEDPMVTVYNSGDVLWIQPAIMKSRCQFDMTNFPFDTQHCTLKLGSWTYDDSKVDVDFYEGQETFDMSDYVNSAEWDITGSNAEKVFTYYIFKHDASYTSLNFNLTIARKNSVYAAMSVTPFIFLAILCPIIFLFPYSETQRFSLGGCILICLVLMLSSLDSILPASAGGLPVLGKYYISILVLLSLSLIFSTIIVNLADRKSGASPPPNILKVVLIDGLGKILCVSKGGSEELVQDDAEKAANGDSPKPRSDSGAEWRVMAQVLDRLFFIVYVVLTVILTLAFFA